MARLVSEVAQPLAKGFNVIQQRDVRGRGTTRGHADPGRFRRWYLLVSNACCGGSAIRYEVTAESIDREKVL